MKIAKKLLSVLWAFVMLISICVMAVTVQGAESTGGYMVLSDDTDVDLYLTEDLYVDLNGYNMGGTIQTNGFKVYGMDSSTNRYTDDNVGYFTCVDAQGNAIIPESNVKTNLSGKIMRYVTITADEGYSFHRIYMGVTKQNLAPSVTGVGFKSEFYADAAVLEQMDAIGYNLWLEGGKTVSCSAGFKNQLTLRVNNFDVENYGETKLYASVWMTIGGETITSSECSLTLRGLVEYINANTGSFAYEQLQAVRNMIEENPVMQNWQIENIFKDVELVTATFADVQLVNVHLGSIVNGPKALRDHLNYAKSINAEVLFMPGDIVNNADQSYYDRFWSIFKSVYGEDESQWPELIWAMGNHEWYDSNEKDAVNAIELFKANAHIESENLVKMSQVSSVANPGQTVANYYKVVKGIPFVVISADGRAMTVTEEQKAELISWLDEISQLPAVKAGAPIYVAYHLPIADVTYFGQGASDVSEVVDDILKKYPNTIVFTGDTHCPGVNERTINQIDYTSINLGSSSYSRIVNRSATSEPGDRYYNVGGNNAKDIVNGEVAFGYEYTPNLMVLKNYTNGSVDMDRYWTDTNPADVRKVGITWNFPAGLTKDKFIYTYDRFENKEWANILYGKDGLTFADNASISFSVDGTDMIVYFDDVTDHNYAEHYKITVTADGTASKVYDVVGNYFKYYEEAQTYHIPLSDIPAGTSYSVEVKAYDFFDNESLNSLVATAESETDLFHNQIEAAISGTYTDISTKINYEVTAGSVASLEYFFQGEHLFNAGATLGTVLNTENLSLAEEFTVTDWSHGILSVKVKNAGDVAINVGLTVVVNDNGQEKWLSDFTAAYRKTVAADGQWAELQWDLYELFGITSLEQVNAIRLKANSSAPSADGYKLHLYLDDIDILQGEPIEIDLSRGDAIEAGVNKVIEFKNAEVLETISFEYKVVDGDKFNLALMKDWSNFYSYYAFNATGSVQNYTGVTTETMVDGYIRVTIQIAELNQVTGSPDGVIDFLYIRGDWSDVNGYIDNVSYTVYKPTVNFEGAAFAAGVGVTIELKDEKVNDLAVTRMTFDYTIETGKFFHVALMPDWSSYYGHFKFDSNGVVGNYPGVTTKMLADGSIRAYFDLTKLTSIAGNPTDVITMLYIRGGNDYVNGNGAISNICINDAAEYAPRGQMFTAGMDKTIDPANKGVLNSISFEYKLESGNEFNIALMPNWSSFYGYFSFGATGANDIYDGVTTQVLEDGYIRVTFDMAALTKYSGTPTADIDFLYIRGNWSDANGYIDNVIFE